MSLETSGKIVDEGVRAVEGRHAGVDDDIHDSSAIHARCLCRRQFSCNAQRRLRLVKLHETERRSE